MSDWKTAELERSFHRDGIGGGKQGLEQRLQLFVVAKGNRALAAQMGFNHGADAAASEMTGNTHHAHGADCQHRQRETVIPAVDRKTRPTGQPQLGHFVGCAARGSDVCAGFTADERAYLARTRSSDRGADGGPVAGKV